MTWTAGGQGSSSYRCVDAEQAEGGELNFDEISQKDLFEIPGMSFVTEKPHQYVILSKLKCVSHKLLGDVIDEDKIQRGVSPDLKEAFLVDNETVGRYDLEKTKLRKVLTGGKHVKRYFIDYPDLWLIYTTRNDDFRKLPHICSYIDQFKDRITCKEVKQQKHPLYSLHRPRNEHIFLKKEKALGVITGDRIIVSVDTSGTYATDGLYIFNTLENVNLKYVLGILNSKLFVFIYRLLTQEKGRILAQVKPTILSQLPIRTIDFDDRADAARHERMVALVQRMLDLHKRLAAASLPQDKELLQRRIDATDRQIDALVYELYGLTGDEIAIVEDSAA